MQSDIFLLLLQLRKTVDHGLDIFYWCDADNGGNIDPAVIYFSGNIHEIFDPDPVTDHGNFFQGAPKVFLNNCRALEKAVKGMLPKGPLGYAMIKKLKVYGGAEHPHTAQQPKVLEI